MAKKKNKGGRPKKYWNLPKNKVGRPPADDPKRNRMEIRMDDHDVRMVELMCKETKFTQSEVIRLCVWLVFHGEDRDGELTALHKKLHHKLSLNDIYGREEPEDDNDEED